MSDPITFANVQQVFPAPAVENPFAGEPYWVLQGMGLLVATQVLRVVPPGPAQQLALQALRRTIDIALTAVPHPDSSAQADRLAQTLAPWVPTPHDVVDAMLALARPTPDDVLYDLGCGDGRVVLKAAMNYHCRGVGIDISASLIAEALAGAHVLGVDQMTTFRAGDVLEADFSEATIVTLFLVTSSMRRLEAHLRALKPGTRIVSHAFEIPGWTPDRVVQGKNVDGAPYRLLLWKV